jgi:WD40 repeat protein/serine/threonine protein kinase
MLRYFGDYELLGEVGRGGMGVVYKARQLSLNRIVALKVIAPEQLASPKAIERFHTEAEAAASLDHPNIVPIYQTGELDGRHCFSMKLIEGQSLALRIADFRLPIFDLKSRTNVRPGSRSQLANRQLQIANLLAQVADAVHYAHQRGILHRDLKPGNILIDSEGRAYVSDFGLAKLVAGDSSLTLSGEVLGTPAYMAPEQAAGKANQITTSADVYSLGAILYELLAGRPPFHAETSIETLHAVVHEEATAPHALNRAVPRDLETICLKCLQKEPARRYANAQALVDDLRRFALGEPIQARPATRPEKLWRWCKRKPSLAATLLLLHIVLAIGLSGILWEWHTARQNALIAGKNLYAANMNLVQQAWEQNNLVRMSELVQQTASYPNRGFEWYFWQRQTHLRLRTFSGRGAVISCVAFSPDGKKLATAGSDSTASVWDVANNKELLRLKGHKGWVRAVAFSPDGLKMVTGGGDATAIVWSATSGKELARLKGHHSWIECVAFSPDSQKIVTSSRDGTAKVWTTEGGKELLTLRGHSGAVNAALFSPDGERILTGNWDQTAKLWRSATGEQLLTLRGHTTGIYWVTFSPDGKWIATGSIDGTAKVWDAVNGREVLSLRGHRGNAGISSLEFSPDSRIIATGSEDATAKLWELAGGKEVLTLEGHTDAILSVAFSPDGRHLATSSLDRTAKVWALGNDIGQRRLKGHGAEIRSVAFSSDGSRIVTGSWDGTAKIWETASGRQLLTLSGHRAGIASVAFSPDGLQIGSGSGDQTAAIWDPITGRQLRKLSGHAAAVNCVAFSPDARWIATGSADQTAKVFDVASGKELHTLKGHRTAIRCIAFSPDGQRIATGSEEGARLWVTGTGKALGMFGRRVSSVAFSADGQHIATGSLDGTTSICDVSTGKELATLSGHRAGVFSVAFSPDGNRISACVFIARQDSTLWL